MVRRLSFFGAAILSLALMYGCPKLETDARDVAATAQGVIEQAQKTHLADCQANPQESYCQTINKAVAAQNTLLDVVQSYCGWPTRPTVEELQAASGLVCARVKDLQAGLQLAVRNVNDVLNDVRKVAHP